ncbi:MAG: molybdopterin biosynthesis protein [Phototrophicaceae bacterium]
MTLQDRNIYLENIPIEEARAVLASALANVSKLQTMSGEIIPLRESLGRVTSEAIWAKMSAPHYHAAAMDGYAVMADDTVNATETRPITLSHEQITEVNTGAAMPSNRNAVIMIEHTQSHADGIIITAAARPWQHVRMLGEDIVATELVIPANHKIRPVDIGAIAGCGHHQISVYRQPHVVIIPTGSELVTADTEPQAGQIIEYNSLVLAAQIEEAGGKVTLFDIQPDQQDVLAHALKTAQAYQPDLILILSGSSAGSKDFTASIIDDAGQVLVHGIAVRPGHPVIIGMVEMIPVIGVPGYPVSAALTGELFIQHLIAIWLGQQADMDTRPRISAQSTRKITSATGDDDFVRVTVAKVGDKILATPLARGAGVITSLLRADGLAHIPRFSEGVNMRDPLTVILYRTMHAIEQTVLTMGSHDPMLDLLAQFMAAQHIGTRLTSANVGSMGGLVALKRDETHLAGMHLLDGASGEYNIPYIEKQLKGIPLTVVTFAHREQGLIVQRGNPKNIQSLDDLVDLTYVNRQRGAGTRLLLDYELAKRGIIADEVRGYEREEYTHLAVASSVATGIADCGLGVRSAALALQLDFIPVGWERYDFVIPEQYAEHQGVVNLLDTLSSETFKSALSEQAGYKTDETGQIQFSQ